MMEVTSFICSICGEESHEICVFCTKDACSNHLCERCRRCSDCCECEVPVTNHHGPVNEYSFETIGFAGFTPDGSD